MQVVNTCSIVVEVARDGASVVLGALADSVQEVNEMEPSRVKVAPHWLRCRIGINDFKQL